MIAQDQNTSSLETTAQQVASMSISSRTPLIQFDDTPDDLPPAYEPQAPSTSSNSNQASFKASEYVKDGKVHLLLAAAGSVATIKLPEIIKQLADTKRLSIRVILTESATHFLGGQSVETPSWESLRHLPLVEGVYTDEDEWSTPWQRGNPILHVELRKWADILLVAPLDANTLAKISNGLADNLLTSVIRAWDPNGSLNPIGRRNRYKYLVVAPAMNTAMWLHPVTKKQISVLTNEWTLKREFKNPGETKLYTLMKPWAKVLQPAEKGLACGDTGVGAMMDWKDIVAEILYQLEKYQ